MQSINTQNWTYCRYQKGKLLALITFGSSPESLDDELEYYVTILEDQEKEVAQHRFNGLGPACAFINEKYSDWNFVDELGPKTGCSTCAAH